MIAGKYNAIKGNNNVLKGSYHRVRGNRNYVVENSYSHIMINNDNIIRLWILDFDMTKV